MMNDFYTNLTTITNNLEDIAFTKYATITNLNSDGTCTAKEDEEEGLTHENINTLGNNLRVGDKVVLGFVDNSIYNPVILTGGEEAYTKTEADALLQKKINEPINEGRNGQVLTTDGNGGRTWKTVQGGGGTGIASIVLRSTSGKVKTYRITFTDGNTFDYQVTDGSDASVTIVTSWNSTTSNSKVPSEKLTKDSLDAKADTGHTHTISNVTNLQTTLDGKASSSHSHSISDVTNLQTNLNGKINTSDIANNLTTTSSGKVLDARQGKALADLIGTAIQYINQ